MFFLLYYTLLFCLLCGIHGVLNYTYRLLCRASSTSNKITADNDRSSENIKIPFCLHAFSLSAFHKTAIEIIMANVHATGRSIIHRLFHGKTIGLDCHQNHASATGKKLDTGLLDWMGAIFAFVSPVVLHKTQVLEVGSLRIRFENLVFFPQDFGIDFVSYGG